MIEKQTGSIIVTANTFNPSIFSQVWLLNQGIVKEDDFAGDSISTAQATQHQLKNMQLVVIPPRLQISFPPDHTDTSKQACDIISKIVERLPHTPFDAAGLNFEHVVSVLDSGQQEAVCRQLFLVENTPLSRFFSDGEPRYGAYYSRRFEGMRMRLEIKPITPTGSLGDNERLRFGYNFHMDVSSEEDVGKRCDLVIDALKKWEDCQKMATELTQQVIEFVNDKDGSDV